MFRRSTGKLYRDIDAPEDYSTLKTNDVLSSRPTTSYRDLTDDRSYSSSPIPSPSDQPAIPDLLLDEPKDSTEDLEEREEEEIFNSKETFYNQTIPYPVINDKRDLELINRQLKNQLRQLEASKNNPAFDQQANLMQYERLKKQNEYINLRIRMERSKRHRGKTQREREQSKKQFPILLQVCFLKSSTCFLIDFYSKEFRKLQRFMRSANRDSSNNPFLTFENENFASAIPLPPSPEVKQPSPKQEEEFQLPPIDLHKVTGKKILFESSDSEDEETPSEPQVPVSLSASESRAVPDGFNQNQPPPLPMPSSSSSSAALDAIKTRVANLINAPSTSSSQTNQSESTTKIEDDEDEDDDTDDQPPVINPERNQAISAKFNRKRRKGKRNKNKKKNAKNSQTSQEITDENDSPMIDQEEAWKRHVAMQLQFSFLKGSNPILRALTAEAHKKLGVSPEVVNGK